MISAKIPEHTPKRSIEIVIVDNDPITCMLQQIKLSSRFSLPISVYEHAREALEFMSNAVNTEFLVILDIDMPMMDGWDFLTEWGKLETSTEIHVVMVSCSINQRDKEKSRTFSEVVDYFEKPLYDSHMDTLKSILSSIEKGN